jgi:hypothetical protein
LERAEVGVVATVLKDGEEFAGFFRGFYQGVGFG